MLSPFNVISSLFLFIERLLAAQNPLAQADRPHQLFADAPPAPVAATTLAPAAAVMPPAVMAVPVPGSMPTAPNMPPSGPPMPPVPPGMPPPGKLRARLLSLWQNRTTCSASCWGIDHASKKNFLFDHLTLYTFENER